MNFTIDANVFVSASVTTEINSADSGTFLDILSKKPGTIYCPTLVLTETVAAIIRPTGDIVLARQAIRRITTFPSMSLVNFTRTHARRAANLATAHRLRGADAVYVAVAVEYGATLVTWDAKMLQRAPAVVPTVTPAEWLATNAAKDNDL